MYELIRPALFAMDAERAHDLTLAGISRAAPLLEALYGARVPRRPVSLMGLELPNPVGLAAGLDKNGAHVDGLAALGFGFIEVGTVTPRPQPGNPRPRLFRLPEQRALLNRFGFNNAGAAALVDNLAGTAFDGVVGVNIGKNKTTPADRAIDDYRAALGTVYKAAHYVAINISSPNTAGLRDWQGEDALEALLMALMAERDALADKHGRYLPLAVKIAPDIDAPGLDAVAERLLHHRVDGVIATNTTTAREGVPLAWRDAPGGLSGKPLRGAADRVIAALYARLGERIPIIGVGGIMSGTHAAAKIAAGARAVQLYSGLVYRGPDLVNDCVRVLSRPPDGCRRRRGRRRCHD